MQIPQARGVRNLHQHMMRWTDCWQLGYILFLLFFFYRYTQTHKHAGGNLHLYTLITSIKRALWSVSHNSCKDSESMFTLPKELQGRLRAADRQWKIISSWEERQSVNSTDWWDNKVEVGRKKKKREKERDALQPSNPLRCSTMTKGVIYCSYYGCRHYKPSAYSVQSLHVPSIPLLIFLPHLVFFSFQGIATALPF